MSKYCVLSYPLDAATAFYPAVDMVAVKPQKRIARGDSCNTFSITLSNHSGTHIETIRHFYDSGKFIEEHCPEDFIFNRPFIVDCPKERNESISRADLEGRISDNDFDLLLIRTGFSKYRVNRQMVYTSENPYMLPETAQWIREKFPNLRAIAIDCISFSSVKNRDIGRQVHRILLREEASTGSTLFLIEDAVIPSLSSRIKEVRAFPVFLRNVDASPCTIIGVWDD
jgi:kynurenine formamidase